MKFFIGRDSSILLKNRFDIKGGLEIGHNSVINGYCRIDNRAGVKIGNNVSISEEVVILTADHDIQDPNFKGRKSKVIIEDYVFIGTRAMILPGVRIGAGAVLAAGALCTKSIPPYEVWAGVPARKIDERNPDLVYNLKYNRLLH